MHSIRILLLAIILFMAAGACGASTGSRSLDPIEISACELAPVARQVSTELRDALAAAQLGDAGKMSTAAKSAGTLGTQIIDAMARLDQPGPPEPLVAALLGIGLFGQQGSFFFADDLPAPDALVQFRATLPGLEQLLGQLDAGASRC